MAFSTQLAAIGRKEEILTVQLSNELVHLLSEQLYNSPLKAIEELVVNGFDADAEAVRIITPRPGHERHDILVYDDGQGMNAADLANLWYIGRSRKRESGFEARFRRKQIGRFGIGKLATYALSQLVTYVTKTKSGPILAVTLDYSKFLESATGAVEPVKLTVNSIKGRDFKLADVVSKAIDDLKLDLDEMVKRDSHWTLVVLENLKERGGELNVGRLKWVLQTAMPPVADFSVWLNHEKLVSSKANPPTIVAFDVKSLPKERLKNIERETGQPLKPKGAHLVGPLFPNGISGTVIVTERSLHTGKSSDLVRGNGFFVRVRGRLINEEDELFGLHPLTHEVFNRFRADVNADDLDEDVRAGREAVAGSDRSAAFREVLNQLFNEARIQFEKVERDRTDQSRKKEHEREYTLPRLAEEPVADALAALRPEIRAGERSGYYLQLPRAGELDALVTSLYNSPRRRFRYEYEERSRTDRLARFDPDLFNIAINEKHDFTMAHSRGAEARLALEDTVTAEVLLEAYLINAGVNPAVTVDLLERRDFLLRSLAKDHLYSLKALAEALRDSAGSERDLEAAVVSAFRALGFAAQHVSDSGKPDGIATYYEYGRGETKIVLEAKASATVPTLAQLDLAGCHAHMQNAGAVNCIVVAPDFPGDTKGKEAAAAVRAQQQGVSLWRIEDLAKLVEAAEERNITAVDVLRIARDARSPKDVQHAITKAISEPKWTNAKLASAIVQALIDLQDRLPDSPRTIDMVASEVSRHEGFRGVTVAGIKDVLAAIATYSKGMMTLRGDQLMISGTLQELSRRIADLTGESPPPRRSGSRGKGE
jgi:Histidine kinase-, DNA gyrase B-, and HSP90-like ATPase/Restriction endonuclease